MVLNYILVVFDITRVNKNLPLLLCIADLSSVRYKYGVRGVSQTKFTMSDSFLVFYDFDILSMIKEKSFWFLLCHFDFKFVAFDFSNNSLIFKVCRVWFLKCIFDFQNLTRLISQMTLLISKIYRVWFLKWHFWFPKFVAFDFSNDTFDFQNLSRLISQMTLEFDFQNFLISITKWTLMFSKFVEYALWMRFWLLIFSQSIS